MLYSVTASESTRDCAAAVAVATIALKASGPGHGAEQRAAKARAPRADPADCSPLVLSAKGRRGARARSLPPRTRAADVRPISLAREPPPHADATVALRERARLLRARGSRRPPRGSLHGAQRGRSPRHELRARADGVVGRAARARARERERAPPVAARARRERQHGLDALGAARARSDSAANPGASSVRRPPCRAPDLAGRTRPSMSTAAEVDDTAEEVRAARRPSPRRARARAINPIACNAPTTISARVSAAVVTVSRRACRPTPAAIAHARRARANPRAADERGARERRTRSAAVRRARGAPGAPPGRHRRVAEPSELVTTSRRRPPTRGKRRRADRVAIPACDLRARHHLREPGGGLDQRGREGDAHQCGHRRRRKRATRNSNFARARARDTLRPTSAPRASCRARSRRRAKPRRHGRALRASRATDVAPPGAGASWSRPRAHAAAARACSRSSSQRSCATRAGRATRRTRRRPRALRRELRDRAEQGVRAAHGRVDRHLDRRGRAAFGARPPPPGKPKSSTCAQRKKHGVKVYSRRAQRRAARRAAYAGVGGLNLSTTAWAAETGALARACAFPRLPRNRTAASTPRFRPGSARAAWRRVFRTCLDAGYAGAQLGTRLFASDECVVPDEYKQALARERGRRRDEQDGGHQLVGAAHAARREGRAAGRRAALVAAAHARDQEPRAALPAEALARRAQAAAFDGSVEFVAGGQGRRRHRQARARGGRRPPSSPPNAKSLERASVPRSGPPPLQRRSAGAPREVTSARAQIPASRRRPAARFGGGAR